MTLEQQTKAWQNHLNILWDLLHISSNDVYLTHWGRDNISGRHFANEIYITLTGPMMAQFIKSASIWYSNVFNVRLLLSVTGLVLISNKDNHIFLIFQKVTNELCASRVYFQLQPWIFQKHIKNGLSPSREKDNSSYVWRFHSQWQQQNKIYFHFKQ